MLKQIAWGMVLVASVLMGVARADDALNQELFTAVRAGDKAKIEALIAKGADVNAKSDDLYTILGVHTRGWMPLHLASADASEAIAELLIAKGADVNAKDTDGNTPLHVAVLLPPASQEKLHMIELLIAKGADVHAKNNKGETPLTVLDQMNTKGYLCLLSNYAVDKDCVVTKHDMTIVLMSQISKGLNERQLLQSDLGQFKGHSGNDDVRKSIIALVLKMKPAPTIPPEAEDAAGRGAYIFKNAKSMDDTLSAAKEYLEAIELAPWVANYYYNLCTVLEKTPYTQQALHACKLYLVAAPNAADAADMRQRIAGLQYAADRNKAQMQQRTADIGHQGHDQLYRQGGIPGTVSGKDIVLKLVVDWQAAPPKYQVFVTGFDDDKVSGRPYDLVSTDDWIQIGHPSISLHLIIKPEGEGFVGLSDASGNGIRTTLDELFAAKQKTMAQATMVYTDSDQGQIFYIPYVQGGVDLQHAGMDMYASDCNGTLVKQDPRALPDDFLPGVDIKNGGLGKFSGEVGFDNRPVTDVCSRQFASKTGYHFGESE